MIRNENSIINRGGQIKSNPLSYQTQNPNNQQFPSKISQFYDYEGIRANNVNANQNKHNYGLKRNYPSENIDVNKKNRRYKYEIEKDREGLCERPTLINQELVLKSNRSKFTSINQQYKKQSNNEALNQNSERKEVRSIIFDSKIQKIHIEDGSAERLDTQNQNSDIVLFKKKVNKVNNQIEEGLNHLQIMIRELKEKKRKKNVENKFDEINYIEQIALRELNKQRQQQVYQKVFNAKNIQEIYEEKIACSQEEIEDSKVELIGSFNDKQSKFPPQFTSFINRFANQIQMDCEFTALINNYSKSKQIGQIKSLIFEQISKYKNNKIDESFFQIQYSEIDPLDNIKNQPYVLNEQELKSCAFSLYKSYKDIENHFQVKLRNKFTSSVIKLLFDELTRFNFTKKSLQDHESVTVGHLMSYLNMRTNRCFRNRSFVKMMKRLNLKPNLPINIDSLKVFLY